MILDIAIAECNWINVCVFNSEISKINCVIITQNRKSWNASLFFLKKGDLHSTFRSVYELVHVYLNFLSNTSNLVVSVLFAFCNPNPTVQL